MDGLEKIINDFRWKIAEYTLPLRNSFNDKRIFSSYKDKVKPYYAKLVILAQKLNDVKKYEELEKHNETYNEIISNIHKIKDEYNQH